MKFDVSEQVAAAAVSQLQRSSDPNVQTLARQMDQVLKRQVPLRLTATELGALETCGELALAREDPDNTVGDEYVTAIRSALPKLRAMLARELARV